MITQALQVQKPWRHVKRAVDAMHAGDTCTIREGRYFEEVTVSGLQGTSEEPITFRSYPGEHVVFDGTVPIVSTWEKYRDSIYVTTIQEDIWQLFVDGEMQILNARWPTPFGMISRSLTTRSGHFPQPNLPTMRMQGPASW